MKHILSILFLICIPIITKGQALSGSTGLLNIPNAKMQTDGTFMFGTNFLPEKSTPDKFDYNTANYFLNITLLPFAEVNYRCTLIKSEYEGDYTGQDRSFGLRLSLYRETKKWPSLVLGFNDLYSEDTSGENHHLGALYMVATKHYQLSVLNLAFTLGSGFRAFNGSQINGPFAGLSISPRKIEQFSLIFEYDSKRMNIGTSILFFKHLYANVFLYDCKQLAGGLAYKIYLGKNK